MKKIYCFLTVVFLFSALSLNLPASESTQGEGIEVKTVQSFAYCCIHRVGSFTEIENVINQIFPVMQSQNISPAGSMIGVYYSDPQTVAPEKMEWEIGFPCSAQVNPVKPLEKKIWKFELVASAIHTGPYENAGETYMKIFDWMEANGYEAVGPMMEKYLSVHTADTNPETLRAELWVPVQKK